MRRWTRSFPLISGLWGTPVIGTSGAVVAPGAEMPATGPGEDPLAPMPQGRHGVRVAWRWIRDLSIGAALIASMPFAMVAIAPPVVRVPAPYTAAQRAEVARVDALRLPSDASITPQQAGEALARLLPVDSRGGFRARSAVEVRARLREIPPPDTVWFRPFVNGRAFDVWDAVSQRQIIPAVARGVGAAEVAWLERMAALPHWRDVEIVAQARSVDVMAGRFAMPLPIESQASFMPYPETREVRRLITLGIARAAWHVSRDEHDMAEVTLRTLVSFGFALLENGLTFVEISLGYRFVAAGSRGLQQLATSAGHARSAADAGPPTSLMLADEKVLMDNDPGVIFSVLQDETVPHGRRMDLYRATAYLECSTVRGVLFGPSPAVKEQLSAVRERLARFPSERQWLLMLDRALEHSAGGWLSTDLLGDYIWGASHAVSAITGNSRVAGCIVPLLGVR